MEGGVRGRREGGVRRGGRCEGRSKESMSKEEYTEGEREGGGGEGGVGGGLRERRGKSNTKYALCRFPRLHYSPKQSKPLVFKTDQLFLFKTKTILMALLFVWHS